MGQYREDMVKKGSSKPLFLLSSHLPWTQNRSGVELWLGIFPGAIEKDGATRILAALPYAHPPREDGGVHPPG